MKLPKFNNPFITAFIIYILIALCMLLFFGGLMWVSSIFLDLDIPFFAYIWVLFIPVLVVPLIWTIQGFKAFIEDDETNT